MRILRLTATGGVDEIEVGEEGAEVGSPAGLAGGGGFGNVVFDYADVSGWLCTMEIFCIPSYSAILIVLQLLNKRCWS